MYKTRLTDLHSKTTKVKHILRMHEQIFSEQIEKMHEHAAPATPSATYLYLMPLALGQNGHGKISFAPHIAIG